MVVLGEAGRVLPVVDNTDERRRFATQSKHSKQKSGISFCASARVNRKATRVGQPLEVDCWNLKTTPFELVRGPVVELFPCDQLLGSFSRDLESAVGMLRRRLD
ncbi:protein GAMETE EXPRESSED 1-like [Dorcoceras hygrometricum]|uniref:Protein GAMETE EXPRESSED 1-like n=1 Tax=Dorcoceras hygrometricum TaxID=472368 RepID=A0A2Z7BKV7_9LAMI|nr:protein GAMETE EXPRESSED 1-like [Dorcoceras hygrometricum]